MAFQDTILGLAFTGRSPDGQGFLPPRWRSFGHITHLLGMLNEDAVTVTPDDAIQELTEASRHWGAGQEPEAVSTATRDYAARLHTAIDEAILEYNGWTEEQRINNIRNLNQRIAQFTALLDRELVGLRDSDPGIAL